MPSTASTASGSSRSASDWWSPGIGHARRPVLPGAGRWLVLVMGGYVFVVMFPAVFGPLVAGRLAIGVWMLMFAVLGMAPVRADRDSDPLR